ncbi:MAG: Ig-like domain-containing protein, partial [Nitrosomonas sp.]|nr:Ig-like domain-containing protein [Nitrosomonas sp.]
MLIVAMGMSFTTVADDSVPITPAECKDRPVSSTPALIEEGRRLFKEETFNGNGRTCETCHRENRNFTIDPEFIATLPGDDPLFVAEFNAALRDLENSEMMRRFGLILINIDGFDKPGVLRSAPHLLGLSQTTALGVSELVEDELKPVHETGWSADGAPGDGSLRCFPVGSVIQHFTKSMDRVNGDDFRLPTEHELDALLVYMLAQGRQSTPMVSSLTFLDPAAERGKTLFFGNIPVRNPNNTGTNNCSQCHEQAGANNRPNFVARNRVINANLSPNAPICRAIALNPSLDIPADGGFGMIEYDDTIACSTGDVEVRLYSEQVQNPRGFFNTPSLHESADTGPYFHNNSAETLEDAIRFYSSDTFNDSGNDIAFVFGPTDVDDISAFLRAINAIENARSAIDYIDKALASSGGKIDSKPLKLALADSNDGIKVLTTGPLPSLFPEAVNLFHDANEFLNVAIDSKDRVAAGHAKQKLATVSLTVVNTTPLPDVIVTSVSYADGIFTSTVTNQGTAATPVGKVIGVGYSVNGNFRTWGAVAGPLAVGASVTIGTNGGPYIIPNGTHTIMADVDDVNRFTESNETNNQLSQLVIVDGGTSPTVSITAPTGGVNVAGSSVTISASAADDIGVSGVQFMLDGANLGAEVTTPPYAVTWDSTAVADGPHIITAVARDADGNTTTSA